MKLGRDITERFHFCQSKFHIASFSTLYVITSSTLLERQQVIKSMHLARKLRSANENQF